VGVSSPLVDPAIAGAAADTARTGSLAGPAQNAPASDCAGRRTPAARRLAGVPAEALAEFPPAWIKRGRGGGASGLGSRLVDPAIAEATADTERTGPRARTAAERALVWRRRNAVHTLHAAWRARRPKRSRNFRPASIERGRATSGWSSSPLVDPRSRRARRLPAHTAAERAFAWLRTSAYAGSTPPRRARPAEALADSRRRKLRAGAAGKYWFA